MEAVVSFLVTSPSRFRFCDNQRFEPLFPTHRGVWRDMPLKTAREYNGKSRDSLVQRRRAARIQLESGAATHLIRIHQR